MVMGGKLSGVGDYLGVTCSKEAQNGVVGGL